MYVGTSIFLIALGAILKFAVTATVVGIDIQTAGLILIIVGIIGLILSLLSMMVWSDRRRNDDAVVEERRYREPIA
jgi:Domain of unknown function (DUF6458)